MTDEPTNVPPSDEVRERQEEAQADAAFARDLARYYLPHVLLAAISVATVWWNASTPGDLWWFPPAIATFWIVWGAFGSTHLRSGAYQHGWIQATAFTMMAIGHGKMPLVHPPHQASSQRVSDVIQAWQTRPAKEDDE